MSLLMTAPQRIVLCAVDANDDIREGSDEFQPNLDTFKRPFILVECSTGTYPPNAAGAEEPNEEYLITIISDKLGQQAKGEAEKQIRQITHDVIEYFQEHTQLQFTDDRGLNGAKLPALVGVKWARIDMRSYVGVVEKGGGGEGEGPFWGTTLTCHVEEVVKRTERLV